MKKKLCFLFLLFFLCIPKVYAEDNAHFSVKSFKASPGQEVTFTISLNNSPAYQLLSLEMPLNAKQVEFISCETYGFSKAMMSSCAMNPSNNLIFYAFTMGSDEKSLLNSFGDIIDVKVKILDKVNSDIPLTLKVTSFGKSESESIPYDVEIGYIRIAGDISLKVINDKENLGGEVKNKDVTWESSDETVATIDSNGNVIFNESGNATISAVDKKGNVLYQKTFLVNKNNYNKVRNIVGIIVGIIVLSSGIFVVVYIIKKKKKDKKVWSNPNGF